MSVATLQACSAIDHMLGAETMEDDLLVKSIDRGPDGPGHNLHKESHISGKAKHTVTLRRQIAMCQICQRHWRHMLCKAGTRW